MFSAEVGEYDPLNPAIQPPVSPPPPSPSPLPLNNTPPPLPSPSPSSSSTLQKCEIAGKRKHRPGDRRRLDAMKRRRIEERRVVRGRDPVTGGRVDFCEDVEGGGEGDGEGEGDCWWEGWEGRA